MGKKKNSTTNRKRAVDADDDLHPTVDTDAADAVAVSAVEAGLESESGEGEGGEMGVGESESVTLDATVDRGILDFSGKLAHNDKVVRDRAVRALGRWLRARGVMPYIEYLKLMKGLHYCLWMADKYPVQVEVARSIAQLVYVLPRGAVGLYWKAFFAAMHKEWHGLDRLRMDKYYMMVSTFIRTMFEWAAADQWSTFSSELIATTLEQGPLTPAPFQPSGQLLHTVDVFFRELTPVVSEQLIHANPHAAGTKTAASSKSGAADSSTQQHPRPSPTFSFNSLLLLLTPFFTVLRRTRDDLVHRRVMDSIFGTLLADLDHANTHRWSWLHPTATPAPATAEDSEYPFWSLLPDCDWGLLAIHFMDLAGDPATTDRYRRTFYATEGKFKNVVVPDPTPADAASVAAEVAAAPSKKKQKKQSTSVTSEPAPCEPVSTTVAPSKPAKQAKANGADAGAKATESVKKSVITAPAGKTVASKQAAPAKTAATSVVVAATPAAADAEDTEAKKPKKKGKLIASRPSKIVDTANTEPTFANTDWDDGPASVTKSGEKSKKKKKMWSGGDDRKNSNSPSQSKKSSGKSGAHEKKRARADDFF